jgi:ABC-type uncharacterized transport system ATPase component
MKTNYLDEYRSIGNGRIPNISGGERQMRMLIVYSNRKRSFMLYDDHHQR